MPQPISTKFDRGLLLLRGVALRSVTLALALCQIAAAPNPDNVHLIGVGTTSPLAVYSKWFEEFQRIRPDLEFTYIPSGSEAGIDMVASGLADFGATDAPLSAKASIKVKTIQIATLMVAVVPVYNLPALSHPLRFTPRALAGIYLGSIRKWNDPAIAQANLDILLPARDIVVIHNDNGRGTTYVWSDYLSKVSAEWKVRIGRGISLAWPVGKPAAGNGNMAKMVRSTPDAIGFVELDYAVRARLPTGQVQNSAGQFITANLATIKAAAEGTDHISFDSRTSITNPPGPSAYPIASFTWMMVPNSQPSSNKQQALKDFLRWALQDGQSYVEPAGFAKLPNTVVEAELKAVEQLR